MVQVATVAEYDFPATVTEIPVTDVEPVPEFTRATLTYGAVVSAAHVAAAVPAVPAVPRVLDTLAVTVAFDVNDPNRPNTNPAIAMAAMSVIAMRMTVAMTGEMAFLPFTFVICMLNPNPSARLNKNCVSTISV